MIEPMFVVIVTNIAVKEYVLATERKTPHPSYQELVMGDNTSDVVAVFISLMYEALSPMTQSQNPSLPN